MAKDLDPVSGRSRRVSRGEDSVAKPWDPFKTSLYFVRSRLPAE